MPGLKPRNMYNFKNEYLEVLDYLGKSEWLCKCSCGETFKTRTHKIKTRKGCIRCTASLVSANKHPTISNYSYKRRLYKDYKIGAKKRNLKFDISFEKFCELIELDCVYCGSKPIVSGGKSYINRLEEPLKRNGIDRINTKKGYINNNVVTCCSKCNYAKHDMSLDEFKTWIKKLYTNIFDESSTTIP